VSLSYDKDIVAIDTFSLEYLALAQKITDKISGCKRNYSFILSDIESSCFDDQVFDLCFCLDSLEHVDHVGKSLKELKRAIRKGGTLIVSVPVEAPLLRVSRKILTLNGRLANVNPHWNGEVKNYEEFETVLSGFFEILEAVFVPGSKLIAYDIFFACRNN